MKITSTIEKISEALSRIQKISSKNISLPVLENVLLIAENNELTFRATNLHTGLELRVPVKVEEEGVVAVSIQVLGSIINQLKNDHTVVFQKDEQKLHIETDNSQMDIKTFEHGDFPTLPKVETDQSFEIPVSDFVEGVQGVMDSASFSEIKPEISSVYLYPKDGNLVFVATDSYRLAEKKVSVKNVEDFPGIIVPIRNISECVKIFQGDSGMITLTIDKNQLSITTDQLYFTSRLVDGNFPNYEQVIPQEHSTSVTLLKDDLSHTLRLVNIFSDDFNQVSLVVDSTKGLLQLSSRNKDVGENTSSLEVVVEGDAVETIINLKYLSDIISVVDQDSLTINFSEGNKPIVVRPVGNKSDLFLLMSIGR